MNPIRNILCCLIFFSNQRISETTKNLTHFQRVWEILIKDSPVQFSDGNFYKSPKTGLKINELNIYKGLSSANHVPSLEQPSYQPLASWIGECLYCFGLTRSLLPQNQSHKVLKKMFTFHINSHLLTTFIEPLFWIFFYVLPNKVFTTHVCGTNSFIHSIVLQ